MNASREIRNADPTTGDPPNADRALLRTGAVAGLLGVPLQVVLDQLHAGHAHAPNDSAGVFREYAASSIWTAVHIGQFFGTLLIGVALVTLAWSIARHGGIARALGLSGGFAALASVTVFAVQMAVDGVALKATVDAWVRATTPADKLMAFQVAEGVRWIEKGLSSFFHLLNGTALLGLGLSVALARTHPRWLGWVGAAAGVGFIAGGFITAHTGFSPEAAAVLTPALVVLVVFLVGTSISMWRRSSRAVEVAPVTAWDGQRETAIRNPPAVGSESPQP